MHRFFMPFALLLLAAGCTARIYDVKMERTIFLDTRKGDRVYLDVKNTSSVQDIPLAEDIRRNIEAKGYTVVDTPEQANHVLRVVLRYTGLMEDALKGEKVAVGAAAGGVVGGVAGKAAGGEGAAIAGGALAGILAGSGLGYWMEEEDLKNTFVSIADFQVTDKRTNKTYESNVFARIREKGLTLQSAAERVTPDVAAQIAGLF